MPPGYFPPPGKAEKGEERQFSGEMTSPTSRDKAPFPLFRLPARPVDTKGVRERAGELPVSESPQGAVGKAASRSRYVIFRDALPAEPGKTSCLRYAARAAAADSGQAGLPRPQKKWRKADCACLAALWRVQSRHAPRPPAEAESRPSFAEAKALMEGMAGWGRFRPVPSEAAARRTSGRWRGPESAPARLRDRPRPCP